MCEEAGRKAMLYIVTALQVEEGIASHVLPCKSLPFFFLALFFPSAPHPPHCLKKKAECCWSHWRLMFKIHSCLIGRAFGPDSPPTITQWIPSRFKEPRSSSRGSTDTNLIGAEIWRSRSSRGTPCSLSSTVTPIHAFSGGA